MSRKEKLVSRLKQKPKDFTWSELTMLLRSLGYRRIKAGKTGGSRYRFVHPLAPPISLHKPHPQNTVKRYVIDDLLMLLESEGLL